MRNFNVFAGFALFAALTACGGVDFAVDADGSFDDGETGEAGGATTSSSSGSASTSSVTDTDSTTASTTGSTGGGGAGVTTGTGGSAEPCAQLLVNSVSHADGDAPQGSQHVPTLRVELTALGCDGGDVTINGMTFQLITPDASPDDQAPFCAGACSSAAEWNFRDLRLRHINGNYYSAPTTLKGFAVNQPALADFTDSIVLADGETITLDVIMDIADPTVSDIQGDRFRTIFIGVDAGPDVVPVIGNGADPDAYVTVQ